MRHAIEKFKDLGPLFRCPVCGEDLTFHDAALQCSQRHTFNINRKGYVDLRRHVMTSTHYTEEFFEARRRAMDLGLYSDLISRLRETSADIDFEAAGQKVSKPSIDIGCGDGFITRALGIGIGLDISLDGIKVAARGGGDTLWVCGDGAHLPLTDASAAWILNVFAPSEYEDFSRICPGGTLIKVVPGATHMHQLRSLVGLPAATQDSATVLFNDRMTDVRTYDVVQTTYLATEDDRRAVSQMSPVGFGTSNHDAPQLDYWKDLENITTHSRVLVGRLP
ncbi:MAG: methyltransferase domain-containing protein [Bifidobacteriaceae bacterium]|jgi:23S rRNA (guanine745-N1)-methyltransferase|nr:methyltransferase domain-containing protein [Bifidobacteriaceae bacterium]